MTRDGEIDICASSAQFALKTRQFVVGNVTSGQHVDLHIGGAQTRLYDEDSALQGIAKSVTANAQGFSALGTAIGRSEAFDFDSITPVGANAAYTMVIVPGVPVNLAV
jgi:hypothetical protein